MQCQLYDAHQQPVSGGFETPEKLCQCLEEGGILYFPESPVTPTAEEQDYLLTQKQLEAASHKNIAYRPNQNRLTGLASTASLDADRLQAILKSYSQRTGQFLNDTLPAYTGWEWDYASYRPLEEEGRQLRLHARNDLIHVDSFPTRPTFGGRILRFFTNIHPNRGRVWQTSDTLEHLLPTFQNRVKLQGSLHKNRREPGLLQKLFKPLGFRQSNISAYDTCMSKLHNAMKEDEHFQASCRKTHWEFPPGSSWMVMTDMLSHSVLSGQYALEQTVIVPLDQLVVPEKAPINILKRAYENAG